MKFIDRLKQSTQENFGAILITLLLVIASICIVSFAELPSALDISIIVSFFVVDVIYVQLSVLNRRLNRIERAINPLASTDLARVMRNVIQCKLDAIGSLRHDLLDDKRCTVPKRDMYKWLIDFTNIMEPQYSDEITAISSTNIEDFVNEAYGQEYLEANRIAVVKGITVRRLFLLSKENIARPDVVSIVHRHERALSPDALIGGSQEPPVKWLLKSDAPPAHQDEDFAIFTKGAMVAQKGSARAQQYIIELNPGEIAAARRTFDSLWSDLRCKLPSELPPPRGKSHQ